jgi:alpha-ribazole phosphatase
MTAIDLLRHGEPLGGRRYRGQIDDPLSEQGWREMWQAVSGAMPWQTIISSPLRRCSEFARLLSEQQSLPLIVDDRLREVGFGSWEGFTRQQLRARDETILSRFYHDPLNCRPEGAEDLVSFTQRVSEAYQQAIDSCAGQHLLIIAHAGVIRSLLTQTLSAPLSHMYRLSIPTASLSRIEIGQERPPTVVFMGRRSLS